MDQRKDASEFTKAANADNDVVVVGAGPAGMECAMVLGKRGMRRVHLVEDASQIYAEAQALADRLGVPTILATGKAAAAHAAGGGRVVVCRSEPTSAVGAEHHGFRRPSSRPGGGSGRPPRRYNDRPPRDGGDNRPPRQDGENRPPRKKDEESGE